MGTPSQSRVVAHSAATFSRWARAVTGGSMEGAGIPVATKGDGQS